jgi:hypothetical protein
MTAAFDNYAQQPWITASARGVVAAIWSEPDEVNYSLDRRVRRQRKLERIAVLKAGFWRALGKRWPLGQYR